MAEILNKLGRSLESPGRLARKAAEAAMAIGIHGVSVSAGVPIGLASTASRDEIERHFRVHDTPSRADVLHRTIELPEPVTYEVAELFNQLFGRS